MQLVYDPGCILLLKSCRKALGEHVSQPPDLLGVLGDGPGLLESEGITGTHGSHGLQGSLRWNLLGHAFKRLVDDRLGRKPSALRLQHDGLSFQDLFLLEAIGIQGLYELQSILAGHPFLNHYAGTVLYRYRQLSQALIHRVRTDRTGQ